jgi:hypothetical protein
MDRKDFGDEEEEKKKKKKEEDNTLAINPSICSGKIISKIFTIISVVTGQITRNSYKALISIINADKIR